MNPILTKYPYKDFFDFCKSDETRTAYGSDFWQFEKVMGKGIADATEEDLIKFITKKRDAGRCDRSLTRYMAGISKFYKWQIATHQRKDNPATAFLLIVTKPGEKNPKSLTIEQRKKLMSVLQYDTVHDFQVSLFVVLGLKTGLRLSEMMRLKWEDINLEQRKLKVIGKGQKAATLNIPEPLVQEFMEYKTLMNESEISSEWVLFNQFNPSKHYTKNNIAKWCIILKQRCGWPAKTKFSPHVLRHTFCTTLNEAGIDPVTAILATRHSQIGTYVSYYVKVDDQVVRDAVDKALS